MTVKPFFQTVGYFFTDDRVFREDLVHQIQWPGGGGPPVDHPPCGFNGEFCKHREHNILRLSCKELY